MFAMPLLLALTLSDPGLGPELATIPPSQPGDIDSRLRYIKFPVMVQAEKIHAIKSITLLVSTDNGRKWSAVATADVNAKSLPFFAPRDGVYCFTVKVVHHDGTVYPHGDPRTQIRVRIDASHNKK